MKRHRASTTSTTSTTRTWKALPVIAGVAILLAACGKSGPSLSGGGQAIHPAAVSGVGTVLVDPNGSTLYHLTTESAGKIDCTGACESVWPPLLAPGGAVPAASGLTGKLRTVTRPDGKIQVTYNGMPLYTYSGDTQPGQATGQGIQGVWYAVTTSGSPSPTSSHGGGYGY